MVNIYKIFGTKFYLTINGPLPVLPGNVQDHVMTNIVNTYFVLPSVQGA